MIHRFLKRLSVQSMVKVSHCWRPARCPRLTLGHGRYSHVWGRMHKKWDLRHWRHCVFSDYSRFTFHCGGHARVCCRQGEGPINACIQPMCGTHGPSVRVWSAIHHERSEMVVLDGTLKRQCHIRLLHDGMLPRATDVFRRNFVYVQDNAMPSTAHGTNAFLGQQDVELMDWSGHELHWACSGPKGVWIRDMDDPPSTRPELWRAVHQVWAVCLENVRTLVERMSRRVHSLLVAREGDTNC